MSYIHVHVHVYSLTCKVKPYALFIFTLHVVKSQLESKTYIGQGELLLIILYD